VNITQLTGTLHVIAKIGIRTLLLSLIHFKGPFDGQDRIEIGYDIELDIDRI
jgi:hypothetical protein